MSLLNRIKDLPTELVHKIFEHYWGFSTNKVLYQLKMNTRETFSISTDRLSSNIGRTADIQGKSPYNDGRVDPAAKEKGLPITISFATLEQILALNKTRPHIQRFYMNALRYTLLLPSHPKIRLNSLLALLKRGSAKVAEDVTTLSRTLDTSRIDYSERRQPSQMPISTRLSEESLHFKKANDAERFFHADMSRALLIRSFSFGHDLNSSWIRGLDNLHFLFWSAGGPGYCADEIYIVAYTRPIQVGRNNANSPLLSCVVRSTEYVSPDCSCGDTCRHDLHRSVYPLEQLGLNTLETMSNEQLMAFRQAHRDKHLIKWPPKYVSYKADDQKQLKIYMDRISSFGGTCEFWENPNCEEFV
ncbi:hypothetical protein QM012_006592 [Aureobasidium pullulans]|uniref:F-box domain-containing protein n=1 Tax=Aureobasidium pullulans TaxID=5580 RepID=A0ABR0TP08_AURPU